MLDAKKLCASAEACLGWPYVSPGTNDARGIDCSGLFVKCFQDQGADIYHGSNTIYRKYCSEKGKLTNASQLQQGMAVFKWNAKTPSKFNDGLGDFQHIGLVTSVQPLRIVHASSAAGCVTTDTKLGKWAYWGWLKDVTREVSESTGIPQGVYVTAVDTDSPAFSAGIQNGDVITFFGESEVATLEMLHIRLLGLEPGEVIPVKVMRRGAEGYVEFEFSVTLGSAQ